MTRRISLFGIVALVLVVLILASGWAFRHTFSMTPPLRRAHVMLGPDTFSLEIADTDALRAHGLSGHDPLLPKTGMLFLFDSDATEPFWMKDMRFAIDIVWIHGDTIVAVTHGAALPKPDASDAELPLYTSPVPYTRVIELAAGAASRYGLVPGQQLQILLP